MATTLLELPARPAATPDRLPFQCGDRLDQPTFHRLSQLLPDGFRAELLDGVVTMPPSTTDDHGAAHGRIVWCAVSYEFETPGVRSSNNASVVLGPQSEPQPDAVLRVEPQAGGRSRVVDRYLHGPPELVFEISVSTEGTDLHEKRREYEQAGVGEYVVVLPRQQRVVWFERVGRHLEERAPDADGVYRSHEFPGFWVDPGALLEQDSRRLTEVLRQGLASPEHAAFVAELAARRQESPG